MYWRNVKTFPLKRQDAVCGRLDSGHCCEVSNVMHQRRTTDRKGVNNRLDAEGGIEDQGDLVILDSRQLNAFAVPGGIVGINLGLFLYAETRNEFSAILAHELAHISQRHFARGVENARRNTLPNLAGLLASIIIMATSGGDAGIAALTATQAAAQQKALKYSRSREAEADRIGILTLADAGMDPRAMAYMFERLSNMNRFAGQRLPEFLLTHPVTQSRISESESCRDCFVQFYYE